MIKVRDGNGNIMHLPTLRGVDGKSAYQYAVEGGYSGTEEEFIKLLGSLQNLEIADESDLDSIFE